MASIQVADKFFVCDLIYDLNPAWEEGTIAAVRDEDPTIVSKYYKLIDSSFVFQYNQSAAPSITSLDNKIKTKITVGPIEPSNPGLYDVWIDTN